MKTIRTFLTHTAAAAMFAAASILPACGGAPAEESAANDGKDAPIGQTAQALTIANTLVTAWGVNAEGQVWQWGANGTWTQMPAASSPMVQVSVGTNVWGVDTAGHVHRWNSSLNGWEDWGDYSATSISAAQDGTVWMTDSGGRAYAVNMQSGFFTLISTGCAGDRGTNCMSQVSVGSSGNIWAVDFKDNARYWMGSYWSDITSGIHNISAAADGTVMGASASGVIYQYDWAKGSWGQFPGGLTEVSVMSANTIWGVNASGQVWQFANGSYQQIPGGLTWVSATRADAYLAAKFAPQEIFDSSATTFPMDAQPFYQNVIQQDQQLSWNTNQNNDPSTLSSGKIPTYYQIIVCGSQIRIKYWFFYGYQPSCGLGQGAHDGDWEDIIVTLSQDMQSVAAVTYSWHGDEYTRLPANGAVNFVSGSMHPIVYPGLYTHSSGYNPYSGSTGVLACDPWDESHDGGGASLNTWTNLQNLGDFGEVWMVADLTNVFTAWGPGGLASSGGVQTHPTQFPPTCSMVAGAAACELGISGCTGAFAYSQCMYGDTEEQAIYMCVGGSTGLYGLDYTLPTTDVGLVTPDPG